VPAEIRLLDVGTRVERVWRLTRAVGPDGVGFARPLPWERKRPIRLSFALPDEPEPLEVVGLVHDEASVEFTRWDEAARQRLLRYVEERTSAP
jgi:hypothetical protein